MNFLKSMFTHQCPRCRSFKMYKKPFQIKKALDMYDKCGNCGQKFEPEPGFYYGAMFLSYIVTVSLMLPIALLLVFAFHWSLEMAMGAMILIAILFFFKIMRFSRSLWIHMVVKYEPSLAKKT